MDLHPADSRWIALFRLGCYASYANIVLMILAVVAYLIWPYAPGTSTMEDIFLTLHQERLAGLVALDLFTIIIPPVSLLVMIALYAGLRPVDDGYALIALVLGAMGVFFWMTARPLAEMIYLSEQYVAATSELAKERYLAAGEALHTQFNGTSWMLSQFFLAFSGLISSFLMFRSFVFTKTTAYIGIFISILALGIFIPEIGPFLSLLATIGAIMWYVLMGRAFYRLGWEVFR